MSQMRNSTSLLGDQLALRQEIAREGYALIRGLIDPDAAIRVAADVRRVLADYGWVSYRNGHEDILRTPIKGSEPPDYWTMYAEVLGLESVNALAWQPRLVRAMRTILGASAYTYPMKTARLVFPASSGGDAIPIHRDNRGGPWIRDMMTTWISLGEIDSMMGGFALLRGSQTYRYQAIEEANATGTPTGLPIPDDDHRDWVRTEFNPGDVVMFHCYTAHKGVPNRSDRIRLSVDYRWQRADQPVHVSSLLPYHYFDKYPAIPGWDVLARDWLESGWRHYPTNAEVLHEKWPEGMDDSVPPSRLVAVRPGAKELWRAEIRNSYEFRQPYELAHVPEPMSR